LYLFLKGKLKRREWGGNGKGKKAKNGKEKKEKKRKLEKKEKVKNRLSSIDPQPTREFALQRGKIGGLCIAVTIRE
jgi:hypothetical protein